MARIRRRRGLEDRCRTFASLRVPPRALGLAFAPCRLGLRAQRRLLSVALSYAVGEWARVWPLEMLVRSMGAYFVRRDSGDPLYRAVLQRYVQMATAAGLTQAVFPEGG